MVSLIGWLLPTRSNRPAAAAQVRRMKQATVEVKSPTSIVYDHSTTHNPVTLLKNIINIHKNPHRCASAPGHTPEWQHVLLV